jgi:glutamate 5-kinase
MPSTKVRQKVLTTARRVVVKVGTSALSDEAGRPDAAFLADLSGQIARLVVRGVEVTLVSSGAVGAGMAELDLPDRPGTLPLLQATAAVGQGQLMRLFHDAFGRHGVKVGQILVTRGDFADRSRYLNIRNTIAALHGLGAVPIINENDSVGVEELEQRFGDNDTVAAMVANLLRADLLVLLSVVDGVLREGEVLDVIEDPAADADRLATGGRSRLGSGGMGSKLRAAHEVTRAGEAVVIANARTPDVLDRLLAGEKLGTVCLPAARKQSSRRRWIGHAARATGRLTVDEGAARALAERGKSLLASGIVEVAGQFERGAIVSIAGPDGRRIARGLTNYSSEQIERIKGLRSARIADVLGYKPYDEVVHRDNLSLG